MGHWRRIASCVGASAVLAAAPLMSQTSIATAMLARERSGLVSTAPVDVDRGVAQPAATLEAALRAAFASAGVAFAGEVVSIDRSDGSVIVRWRVEDAVRGVSAGATYEQKEWTGRWDDGNPRYRVGERALVLLYAPSVAGYASPVGDGVIPLRGDAVTGTFDLRWLGQQVAVTDAPRLRPMLALRVAGGDLALSDALLAHAAKAASVPRPAGEQTLPVNDGDAGQCGSAAAGTSSEDANAHADGAMILGMLHAWQRTAAAGQ